MAIPHAHKKMGQMQMETLWNSGEERVDKKTKETRADKREIDTEIETLTQERREKDWTGPDWSGLEWNLHEETNRKLRKNRKTGNIRHPPQAHCEIESGKAYEIVEDEGGDRSEADTEDVIHFTQLTFQTETRPKRGFTRNEGKVWHSLFSSL